LILLLHPLSPFQFLSIASKALSGAVMKPKKTIAPEIDALIIEVRGQRVILDTDLARIYGTKTFRLNEAVKRNRERFPEDFLFQLTDQEWNALTSQIAISKSGRGGRRTLPYAFTEHGAIMAANILNSPRAIQMSVFVVRAFVKMRGLLTDTREFAKKLSALEQELKARLDIHEAAIVDVLQRIMRILDPPPEPPAPPKPEIGFHIKEDALPYRIRRKSPRL
jgi:hypothetical protein